jgi:hypothetical protein
MVISAIAVGTRMYRKGYPRKHVKLPQAALSP